MAYYIAVVEIGIVEVEPDNVGLETAAGLAVEQEVWVALEVEQASCSVHAWQPPPPPNSSSFFHRL